MTHTCEMSYLCEIYLCVMSYLCDVIPVRCHISMMLYLYDTCVFVCLVMVQDVQVKLLLKLITQSVVSESHIMQRLVVSLVSDIFISHPVQESAISIVFCQFY